MELTPEEKKRIYEEEKFRIEAQEKIKRDELEKEQKIKREQQRIQQEKNAKIKRQNTTGLLIGAGVVVVTIIVLFLIYGKDIRESAPTVNLRVDVNFTGSQFVITNRNNFSYYNARLTVNGDYYLDGVEIDAGETYKVVMREFADKNGNRFTSLMKPQTFAISCSTSDGYKTYFGTFN